MDLTSTDKSPLLHRSATKSIVVLDATGEVFDRLRELDLPVAVWRVDEGRRLATTPDAGLTVIAAYGGLDWERIAGVARRGATIVITTAYTRADAHDALRHDLIGYLDAAMPRPALERAILGVLLHDEPAFDRRVMGSWLRERRVKAANGRSSTGGLTSRQHQIVALIARGATDKEIAGMLGIAQATAQKHVTNILQRLRVPNRAAAVAVVATHRRLL